MEPRPYWLCASGQCPAERWRNFARHLEYGGQQLMLTVVTWFWLIPDNITKLVYPDFELSVTDTNRDWLNVDDRVRRDFSATTFFFVAKFAYTQSLCWLLVWTLWLPLYRWIK